MNRQYRTVEVPFTGTVLITIDESADRPMPDSRIRSLADAALADATVIMPSETDIRLDEWIVPEGAPLRDVGTREIG